MVIGQNEAQFLRQQAASLKTIAERCAAHIRAELLELAEDLENRATQVEKRAG
jgi:hypothetical protein